MEKSETQTIIEQWEKRKQKLEEERDEISALILEHETLKKSLLSFQDDNYHVFSPRNDSPQLGQLEDLSKEIENLSKRKDDLLDEIAFLQKTIRAMSSQNNPNGYSNSSVSDKVELEILSFHEEDRKRIARDLHDTSLQHLTYLVHKLELCSLYMDQDPVRSKLEIGIVRQDIKKIIDNIRATIFDLRPMTFDDLGFKEAVCQLIEEKNSTSKLLTDISIDDVSCENNTVLLNIYRIIQEALSNIYKHAQAKKITVHLNALGDGEYSLLIKDDGIGFSSCDAGAGGDNHFGLFFLQERAKMLGGKFNMESSKTDGTKIEIFFRVK